MRPIPGARGLAQVMLDAQNGWNKPFGHLPRWHNVCCCLELGLLSWRWSLADCALEHIWHVCRLSMAWPEGEGEGEGQGREQQEAGSMCRPNLSPLAHAHSHAQPRSVVVVVAAAAAARHPIRPAARPSGAVKDGDPGELGAGDKGLAALGDPSTRSQGGAREAKEEEGIATGKERGEVLGMGGRLGATWRYALIRAGYPRASREMTAVWVAAESVPSRVRVVSKYLQGRLFGGVLLCEGGLCLSLTRGSIAGRSLPSCHRTAPVPAGPRDWRQQPWPGLAPLSPDPGGGSGSTPQRWNSPPACGPIAPLPFVWFDISPL